MKELIEQAREAMDTMADFALMSNAVPGGPLLVLNRAIDALEQMRQENGALREANDALRKQLTATMKEVK